jgi:CubicO group peptidase (beta-lactamase class C family)
MTKLRCILLVSVLFNLIASTTFAQSTEIIPDVCDVTDREPSTRFYQRGITPDDTTDDEAFWSYSTMSDQRINPNIISEGLAQLDESRTRQAFILIRNGQIVYEEYFNGSSVTDSNNIASVSKSILSALLGIAMNQGHIISAEEPIATYLPEYFEDMNDSRKLDWTIRDFLTMSHRLDWTENISDRRLNGSDDVVGDILALPMVDDSEEFFNYSTGVSHVLSAVLTEATGMSTCEYAHTHLFDPMGIETEFWGVDSQGYFTGGHSVSITAREVAKFGMLFLNEGNWFGQQLVPGWWVVASTTPRIDIGNSYAGYGYYWWLNRIAGYDMYSALGYGGQLLHVIPDLNVVLVTTHTTRGNRRDFAEEAESYEFIRNYLIPAIENP